LGFTLSFTDSYRKVVIARNEAILMRAQVAIVVRLLRRLKKPSRNDDSSQPITAIKKATVMSLFLFHYFANAAVCRAFVCGLLISVLPFIPFSSESVILLIQNLMGRFYIIFKEEFLETHRQVVQLGEHKTSFFDQIV